MPTPKTSLNASPPCRIELRPSRWLALALIAIGVLGAAGLFLTNMPRLGAIALAPLCVAWGLWLARAELSRRSIQLVFRDDGSVEADGLSLTDPTVDWQGPITRLAWRSEDRWNRIVAWPDVIDAATRRELRLWTLSHRADASTVAVAP